MYIAVLTRAASLFFVFALNVGVAFDRFSVSDLSRQGLYIYAETILQFGREDVELHFTLSADQRLLGFGILSHDKRRVFFSESREALTHLFVFFFIHSLDCLEEGRSRHVNVDVGSGFALFTERVAGLCISQPGNRDDIAAARFGGFHLGFASQEHKLTETFRFAGSGIDQIDTCLQRTGNDLHDGNFSNERVRKGLERPGRHRAVRIRIRHVFAAAGIDVLIRRASERRRRVLSENVQHHIDALAVFRVERENRDDIRAGDAASETFVEFPVLKNAFFKVFVQEFFICLGNQFIEFFFHFFRKRIRRRYADSAELVADLLYQFIKIIGVLVFSLDQDEGRLLQFFTEFPGSFRTHLDA